MQCEICGTEKNIFSVMDEEEIFDVCSNCYGKIAKNVALLNN